MIKKISILIIIGVAIVAGVMALDAFAQSTGNLWKPTAGVPNQIQPYNNSQAVSIPQLGPGTLCLHSVGGVIAGTGSDCGSGGSGSTTTINFLSNGSNTFNFVGAGGITIATSSTSTITFTQGAGGSGNFSATGTAPGLVIFTGTNTGTSSKNLYDTTGTTDVLNVVGIVSSTQLLISGTSTLYGNVSSSVTSALWLAGSNGVVSAYGGASACGAGNAVTTISAIGGTTCAAFNTSNATLLGDGTSTDIAVYSGLQALGGFDNFTYVSSTALLTASNTLVSNNLNVGNTINVTGTAQFATTTQVAGNFNVTGTAQFATTTTVGTSTVYGFEALTTGKNYVIAGTLSGASDMAVIGGRIAWSTTSTGNSAGASTSIETFTLPTSTYNTTGDEVSIYAGGTFAATAATNKQIQVAIASSTVFDTGAAFAPANTACNWFLESRGMMTKTSSTIWITQFTDSCVNALTDNSGDAGNATAAITSTIPIVLNIYGNATNGSDVVANYFAVFYSPAP